MSYHVGTGCEATIIKRMKLFYSDTDEQVYERTFSGRMTRMRWKILSSWVRRKRWSQHCGHEWDCCGCMCAQGASLQYKQNQVTIQLSYHFNY